MKLEQLLQSLLVTGSFFVLVTNPALSKEGRGDDIQSSSPPTGARASSEQPLPRLTSAKQVQPIISKIKRSRINGQKLAQSPAPAAAPTAEVIEITGVKANPTNNGVEVILQTTKGEQLQLTNRSTGNNFISDVPNAQLRLPSGEAFTFRSDKPISGITEITVANLDANTVRVTIIGESGLPAVELFDSDEGLIFGVVNTTSAAQQPQTPETPPQQPESDTQPDSPAAETDEPIELVVTGVQDGYRVLDATSATKTDTPLRDIPQSIQVVPRQVIEDRQATTLVDALRSVSGISQGTQPTTSIYENPVIRGFNAISDVFRDGVRNSTNAYSNFERAGVERIEVLKGPASVLYGQGSLGGIINIVTKKPLADPFYEIEASAGSFNFYRGAIDLSGPLNDSKTALYRLNFAARTTESFLDFFERQQYFVAPVFSFEFSDRTKLTLSGEYINTSGSNGQMGLPAIGTVIDNPNGKIPLDRNLSERYDRDDVESTRVGYDLEHKFSQNWQLRSTFQASWIDQDRVIVFPIRLENNQNLIRGYNPNAINYRVFNFDTYTVGKFKTGSIQHQLVTGFNYTRVDSDSVDTAQRRTLAPINIFNPVYNQPLGAVNNFVFEGELDTNTYGFYLQDQITLAENFKVLLGGRFDIANQKLVNTYPVDDYAQQEVFSPRVGVVYQPIKPISLYASYGKSFQPTQEVFEGETIAKPERGTLYEIGIKADFSENLAATLAFYDLTRSNISTEDPNNPDLTIQVGEQNSQGIEFDISGQILPGLNIIAGYAYTDARISKDNNFPVGNRINSVPEHSFNIWTTYELQAGSLKGLGFGLGFFYVGERQGDLANTFELPSYLRTDAAVFYKRDQFRAALNFRNLFNVDYYETAASRLRVYPGAPFEVQGTISWQF